MKRQLIWQVVIAVIASGFLVLSAATNLQAQTKPFKIKSRVARALASWTRRSAEKNERA
jgi:hypothetical protein